MFQFSGFAFLTEYLVFNQMGCPIQKSTDQKIFAPPRSLSQLITSFFASESQGIPCMPFVTYLSFLFSLCYFNQYQYVKEL